MKKLLSLGVVFILCVSFVPIYAAKGDIVDLAVNDGNFKTLTAALQKADLVGALQGEGPFTVFAPTDEAFAKLLEKLDITADQLLDHPQLKEVLLYHVVSGKVLSTDLKDQMMPATLQGEKITIDLKEGVKINQAKVATADLEATNGVIHVIDQVLVPEAFQLKQEPMPAEPQKSIVDIAGGNKDFSTLVAALQKADLVGALQGEGPFTVFAPTNEAFAKLLEKLDITADQLLAHPQLKEVLLYHVVSGKVLSTDLKDQMMPATLQGEKITIDLKEGVKINQAKVTTADLEATNGVIHVIDQVLVPEAFQLTAPVKDGMLPETGDSEQSMLLFGIGGILIGLGLLVILKKQKQPSK